MNGIKRLFGVVSIGVALASGLAVPPGLAQTSDAASAVEAMSVSELMDRTTALVEEGRLTEAEPVARQAVAAAERAFGEDHPNTSVVMAELAAILHRLERLDESEQLYRRILAVFEEAGPGSEQGLATALNNVAEALRRLNRLDEAEEMHRRALALYERILPEGHPNIGGSLNNIGSLLTELGRPGEAEQVLRRALIIVDDDATTATVLNNLGLVLEKLNRFDEAEQTHRRALAIREEILPANHSDIAVSLSNLAGVLTKSNRLEEAAEMLRRALAISEQVLPENHPDIATIINNLGILHYNLNQFVEAEALHRRAFTISQHTLPENHPDIARKVSSLAIVLGALGRLDEAETLSRQALAIGEHAFPANHPRVAGYLNNLGWILERLNRGDEAIEMYGRALTIFEQSLPDNHPDLSHTIHNLGRLHWALGNSTEAEQLLRRSLAIREQALPSHHPNIADSLTYLSALRSARGDYEETLVLADQVAAIYAAPENRAHTDRHLWRSSASYRARIAQLLLQREGEAVAGLVHKARRSAFVDLQRERSGGAGDAIALAAARAQASDRGVAALARERDNVLVEIRRLDGAFLAVSADSQLDGKNRAERLSTLRADADSARQRLAEIDREIAERFPAYSEIAEGTPLPVSEAGKLLAPDEVLLSITPNGIDGLFFALSHDGGGFERIAGAAASAALAARLRCSAAGRLDPACATIESAAIAATGGSANGDVIRGAQMMQNREGQTGEVFDLDLAHDLYNRLFPQAVHDFLRGKKLIIAPAPELMSLPWHLLVTEAPPAGWNASGGARTRAYREAKWLFQSHPSITVLPTIASLRALRSAAPDRATADRAFLGVGDPVIGRTAAERDAPPMECGAQVLVADAGAAVARSAGAMPATLFAGARDGDGFGLADADLVRSQPRLADTRCELAAVAGSLGGTDETADLLFGAEASESRLRALDASGELSRYRILHFATHGLLGGELGLGEPGLVLTPPDRASADDDGILTASEIATLTLAADWVVLSACNTAAGSEVDAEALSGLARSFFYAGARSLLVSSWPVYSPAAVDITTRAFATMNEEPTIGRAEALVMAMRDTLANARTEQAAHPSYWGPFFLVGEGAR